MVSESKRCVFCKQDSKTLNTINSTDVQLLFNENVEVDVCNICLGKIELTLQFRRSLKRSKHSKLISCSVCANKSLYLFDVKQNQDDEDSFIKKIKYCRNQSNSALLKNVCYRCLYLIDLWYELKKNYEIEKEKSTFNSNDKEETGEKTLKRKLSTSGENKDEKRAVLFPISNKRQKKILDSSNVPNIVEKEQTEKHTIHNTKKEKRYVHKKGSNKTFVTDRLKKLQRQLQLDICDADAFLKSSKLKNRRNSETTNMDQSIDGSVNDNILNHLKPASTYFTNNRIKWLKPEIKYDSKMLNSICLVNLNTSTITKKVLKRLKERHFVRVKPVIAEKESPHTPPITNHKKSIPLLPPSSQRKKKKFLSVKKFSKNVPNSKRLKMINLDEIRSYRSSTNSPLRKSPESDLTDFDYGMNRHSYDAFSTDKEKIVMVLLHNVEKLDNKSEKRKSDDNASASSSSSDKTDFDNDDDDEDERRLNKFSCLENYMAGLPKLVINRMDFDENLTRNVNLNRKELPEIHLEGVENDKEEIITPEKVDDVIKERNAKKNVEAEKSVVSNMDSTQILSSNGLTGILNKLNVKNLDEVTSKNSPIKLNMENVQEATPKNSSNKSNMENVLEATPKNNLNKSNIENVDEATPKNSPNKSNVKNIHEDTLKNSPNKSNIENVHEATTKNPLETNSQNLNTIDKGSSYQSNGDYLQRITLTNSPTEDNFENLDIRTNAVTIEVSSENATETDSQEGLELRLSVEDNEKENVENTKKSSPKICENDPLLSSCNVDEETQKETEDIVVITNEISSVEDDTTQKVTEMEDDNEIISLDHHEEIVDEQNNSVVNEESNGVVDEDQVVDNNKVEDKTSESMNEKETVSTNNSVELTEYCEVAQKLAELDA